MYFIRRKSSKRRAPSWARYIRSSKNEPWRATGVNGEFGLFTKDIKSKEDLLVHGLQDMATNRDLSTGLKAHLEETNKQIERLQKVFEKLGKQLSGAQCPAIDGIIKEAGETATEIDDKAALDAAIVANAQAVEHYEICRYGTLIAWAEELGHDEIVRFLTTNLNDEKADSTKLNTVALRKGVNAKASTAAGVLSSLS
jgi:ferritin-like metal-binding protein YciE